MEIFKSIIFIFTTSILIVNLAVILGLILGNSINFPKILKVDLTNRWIFYPTLLYQVYIWSVHFQFINPLF